MELTLPINEPRYLYDALSTLIERAELSVDNLLIRVVVDLKNEYFIACVWSLTEFSYLIGASHLSKDILIHRYFSSNKYSEFTLDILSDERLWRFSGPNEQSNT